MKKWGLLLGFQLTLQISYAQQQWSLQQCIEYAKNNNTAVLNRELDLEVEYLKQRNIRKQRLPSVNSFVNTASSFGQDQDIFGNTQRNDNLNSAFGVTFEINLNTYGRIGKETKKSILDIEVANRNKEIEKRGLIELIIIDYLDILVKQEMVKLYELNIERLNVEHKNIKLGVELGKFSKSTELDSYADIISKKQDFEQTKVDLRLAKLNLLTALELESDVSMELDKMLISDESLKLHFNKEEMVGSDMLRLNPNLDRLRIIGKALESQSEVLKSQLYPTLTLGSTFGTMFYNSYVFQSQIISEQLKRNFYQQLFFRFSIPIYDKSSIKNAVAQNSLMIEQISNNLKAENIKQKNKIENLLINWKTNYEKYHSNIEVSDILKESLKNAEHNFRNGKGTFYELNEVRSKYFLAKSEEIKSKYNCYFQKCLIHNFLGSQIN